MDYFPFLLYFLLVIPKIQTRILPVTESKTLFSDSVTHPPKAVLAGGSIDSPKPQNIVDPPKTVLPRFLKAVQGLRMSADVSLSRKVPQVPKSSLV